MKTENIITVIKGDLTPFEIAEIQAMQAKIYGRGHEGDSCDLEQLTEGIDWNYMED